MNFLGKLFNKASQRYVFTEKDRRWNYFCTVILSWESDKLNPIQKNAVLAFWYNTEMNSGGHSGYFDYYPEINPLELSEALIAIGASEVAENYNQALLHGEEDDYIYTDKMYGELDEEFTKKLMEYVEAHYYEIINHRLDTFEFYDCWLLLSIGFHKKGSTLKEILRNGDILNHSCFSLDELNYGMSKLVGNGYVVLDNGRFVATDKARAFYEAHSVKNEGCIMTLLRMAPLFQSEGANKDCSLIIWFDIELNGRFRTPYLCRK